MPKLRLLAVMSLKITSILQKHDPIRSIIVLFLAIVCSRQANAQDFSFIVNQGQWPSQVIARGEIDGGVVFIEQSGYRVSMCQDMELQKPVPHGQKIWIHNYAVDFVDANKNPEYSFGEMSGFYHNFFIGKNANIWKTKVPATTFVEIKDVFKNVDLRYDIVNGELKYSFYVKKAADFERIRFKYRGLDKIEISDNKLLLGFNDLKLYEDLPEVFQWTDGQKINVGASFRRDENGTFGFKLIDKVDHNKPLVIDPRLVFATYSGSKASNFGYSATNDSKGNAYGAGIVYGIAYPGILGTIDTTFGGAVDILIVKFDSSGANLQYFTYLGGRSNEYPMTMSCDKNDNLVMIGKTVSIDYPVTLTGFDTSYNGGYDLVATKISSNGQVLLGSTFIGGANDDGNNAFRAGNIYNYPNSLNYNYGDLSRTDVAIDDQSRVYIASHSKSKDFPVTLGDTLIKQDAVVLSLDSNLSQMIYSRFLGGSGQDAAYGIVLDKTYGVYVCGGTSSRDFITTTGAFQINYKDSIDGFVTHLSDSGRVLASTYVGTQNFYDQAFFIQADRDYNIYLFGQTEDTLASITPGKYGNPKGKQTLIKLDSLLRTQLWSTRFGTGMAIGADISPTAFLVDYCTERIFIAGWGGVVNGNNIHVGTTSLLPTTAGCFQPSTDANDLYLMVLEKDADSLIYATFMGGKQSAEHVDGGTSRYDRNGVIYQAVCTGCNSPIGFSDFPTTAQAYSVSNGAQNSGSANNCNLVVFKYDFQLTQTQLDFTYAQTGRCGPYVVQCYNRSNADATTTYTWKLLPNGPTFFTKNAQFVFNTPGVYQIQLIGKTIGNAICALSDTVVKNIIVSKPQRPLIGYISPVDFCVPVDLSFFVSTSIDNAFTYEWSTSNGQLSTLSSPVFNFTATGNYMITLIARDTICNTIDTVTQAITLNDRRINANANYSVSAQDCLPDTLFTINNSIALPTTKHTWYIPGVDTIEAFEPVFIINNPGKYFLYLVVEDSLSCNVKDTVFLPFDMSYRNGSSNSYCKCSDGDFIRLYAPAGRRNYRWVGPEVSTDASILAQNSGTYYLYAEDAKGCTVIDTFSVSYGDCFEKIPNVITPNDDGKNDVFVPTSTDAGNFRLVIYNRWGQVVFSSNSALNYWNGRVNNDGPNLVTGLYYYLIEGEFCNGDKVEKHGVVKIIRE